MCLYVGFRVYMCIHVYLCLCHEKSSNIVQSRHQGNIYIYIYIYIYIGWNNKILVLNKTALQLYFKTFIEKINSGNLIMW